MEQWSVLTNRFGDSVHHWYADFSSKQFFNELAHESDGANIVQNNKQSTDFRERECLQEILTPLDGVCVCVCVCARAREREREREKGSRSYFEVSTSCGSSRGKRERTACLK